MSYRPLNARTVLISVKFIRLFLRGRGLSFTVPVAANTIALERKSGASLPKSHAFLRSEIKP